MTEYVARHELNSIGVEIERLESQGAVEIKAVPRRDATFRGLIKKGVHKGEAEAIAWILSLRKDLRPLFVSRDERAIRTALSRGLGATDVMGLVVGTIEMGIVSREQARSALIIWDDRQQQLGRPSDYQDFDSTLARRRRRPPDFYK